MKYIEDYWKDVATTANNIPQINKIYGKSILVTGGTGMICSSIVDVLLYLNKKCNANIAIVLAGRSRERVRKRFECFKEGVDYKFILYDATVSGNLDTDADYIIHGASNATPSAYTKEPVETMLANIIGLNSLLSLAVAKKTTRVLYISSSEVYGNKNGNCPYKENDLGDLDILNQRASYPSAKRAAETLCVAYGQEYQLDTIIVRPGHIYGPTITDSDNRASAQFTRNVVKNENIIMKSSGEQLRSYCYVLDCASAILTVLLCGERWNAYNISNSNSVVSIRELAHTLAKVSHTEVVYENATDCEKKGYNLMLNSSLDASKLESIGWNALFGIEEGVRKTVEIMKQM